MKNTCLAALFAPILLASPLLAQTKREFRIGLPGLGDFPAYEGAQPAFQDPSEAKRTAGLAATLAAMACDGPEAAGVPIAEYIRENKIPIVFAKITGASELENELDQDKPRRILLNETLPPNPQVLGPLIAREASKLMLELMLDTAERRYMIRSLEVRVWIELGGDPHSLPVLDGPSGTRNDEQAAAYKVWLDNGQEMALEKIGQETGTKIIPVLEDDISAEIKKRDPGDRVREVLEKIMAALEKDNKAFTQFLIAENNWKKMNSFRLK